MACYHPIQAYQTADGSVVFSELRRYDTVRSLQVPCGQCVGCRLERSRQWAMRCLHESSLYKRNSFITLTYDDKHLPENGSLRYEDFQLFMKRLRKRFKYSIRFYMCGEYGENFGRPHFHACLFNHDFDDKVFWKTAGKGSKLYRSKALEELWPFGFSSVGDVNFESAAYVARYIMKKITGDAAATHYGVVDPETGEITQRVPEFNHMSLKPGIGARWLEKYSTDAYPLDYVIIRGRKVKPPKYYDRLFNRSEGLTFEEIQYERELEGRARFADNTDARLAVREQVATARLSLYKRHLE